MWCLLGLMQFHGNPMDHQLMININWGSGIDWHLWIIWKRYHFQQALHRHGLMISLMFFPMPNEEGVDRKSFIVSSLVCCLHWLRLMIQIIFCCWQLFISAHNKNYKMTYAQALPDVNKNKFQSKWFIYDICYTLIEFKMDKYYDLKAMEMSIQWGEF